jgi:hypothetical protein
MQIKFKCDLTGSSIPGRLIYNSSEYSIDFVDFCGEAVALRAGGQGCCSITVGTLQIEVGVETGRLLYPWGLCPLIGLEKKHIKMKRVEHAGVYVDSGEHELVAGVAIEIPGSVFWRMFKDVATGWICIGNCEMEERVRLVQFSINAMISLRDEVAIAVWIRPGLE